MDGIVTIVGEHGMTLGCETPGCTTPATSVWSGGYGRSVRACAAHNPMATVTMALPTGFTSRPLCHACGQPMTLGPQQVAYPGTMG